MYDVMTGSQAKDTYIQVRVHEGLKDDIRITANARGLTISALIHSLLTQAVREEKNSYPHLFVKDEQNANKIPVIEINLSSDKEAMKRKA